MLKWPTAMTADVVIFLAVDNTLPGNDRIIADLRLPGTKEKS